MALSRVVSEIFNVEKCCDLEIWVIGHSRSLKVVLFNRSGMVSYYCAVCYNNLGLKDIRLQKCRDIENWDRGLSRSLEMYHSI